MNDYNYVINLTFFAGSDDRDDTDKKLIIVSLPKPFSEKDVKETFAKANEYLSPYSESDNNPLSLTYEQGLNADTLIEGFLELAGGKLIGIGNGLDKPTIIQNCYNIEQWQ